MCPKPAGLSGRGSPLSFHGSLSSGSSGKGPPALAALPPSSSREVWQHHCPHDRQVQQVPQRTGDWCWARLNPINTRPLCRPPVPICTLTRGDGTVPCLPPASPSNSSRQQHEPSPQPRTALSSVGTEMLSHRRTDATVSRVSPSGQVYFSCLRNNQTAPSGCLAPAPRPGRGSLRPVSHSSLSRRCGRRSLWSSFAFSND